MRDKNFFQFLVFGSTLALERVTIKPWKKPHPKAAE
jgi:hypothetical protein